MSRPENTKRESIKSVADAVVWAFFNYGFPRSASSSLRPDETRLENIKSVSDAVAWAWAA